MNREQTKQNIKRSKQLRQTASTYNTFAVSTTFLALVAYLGAAAAAKEQANAAFIIFITAGVLNNLMAVYSVTKSQKLNQQALDILKHNSKEK